MDDDERIKLAYGIFRGGFFGGGPCPVPPWDDPPPWVRDVAKVAYLQGKLDASSKQKTAAPWPLEMKQ